MYESTYRSERKLRLGIRSISFIDVSRFFFYLFFLIKPFYLLTSGSLQIGDLCLGLSFICYLLHYGLDLRIERVDFPLIAFVSAVTIINSMYSVIYGSKSIAFTSLYYVFNLMAVLLFRNLGESSRVVRNVVKLLRFSLIIQAFIYFLHMGRWYSESQRYMGTFNDPNQFGVYVLFSLLMIRSIERYEQEGSWIGDDILAIGLISLTASTGMFLGLAAYYICHTGLLYKEGKLDKDKSLRFTLLVACILIGLLLCYVYSGYLYSRFYIIRRVVSKARVIFLHTPSSTTSIADLGFFRDRGLTKVFYYPEYLLFGSGEGLYTRFSEIHSNIELHSTFLGFCFYYGVFPFSFFLYWLFRNLKGMDSCGSWVEIVPLLVESFTLANHRQPLFWMLLIMTSLSLKRFQSNSDEVG